LKGVSENKRLGELVFRRVEW